MRSRYGEPEVCAQLIRGESLVQRATAESASSEQKSFDFNDRHPHAGSAAGPRTAIFAHELANSLTTIGWSIEFLKMKLVENPILTRVIQSAFREIEVMETLLNEYCRPNDALTVNLVYVDFASLVEDLIAPQMMACRSAGIRVTLESETALPQVRMDALKIKQVITNLCKNAIEAMPQGGRLGLKLYRVDGVVVLEVADSGVGVPEGVDVFQPFKTTKGSGRGIGLSHAREIISAHRGTIVFASDAHSGTTFTVTLPVYEQEV